MPDRSDPGSRPNGIRKLLLESMYGVGQFRIGRYSVGGGAKSEWDRSGRSRSYPVAGFSRPLIID